MTTHEVANRLVELCRVGKDRQAYQELFAADAVALEPAFVPDFETKGLDNLLAKNDVFQSKVQEIHSGFVSEPLVAGNHFSVTMGIDYTGKDGSRTQMEEVCVYEVKDGKVVKEQFFF